MRAFFIFIFLIFKQRETPSQSGAGYASEDRSTLEESLYQVAWQASHLA